jgi:hypothetical protein
LAIESFEIAVEDVSGGKRLTFNWETTGATSARIVSGTSQRFARWWEVPASGTLTVELEATTYRDPAMTLTAFDARGNDVSRSITVDWACAYGYFFEPPPLACPVFDATFGDAANQFFENGRMVWLKQIRNGESLIENVILVLYDNGQFQQFDDTWAPDMPESDPELTPPGGLHQPVRGFGKIWRENPEVREHLGWALAPEQSYEGAWQQERRETLPSVEYTRTIDNRIIKLYGWDRGNWEYVAQ